MAFKLFRSALGYPVLSEGTSILELFFALCVGISITDLGRPMSSKSIMLRTFKNSSSTYCQLGLSLALLFDLLRVADSYVIISFVDLTLSVELYSQTY